MDIVKREVPSNFGLVPVVHLQLASGDAVNAYDLRGLSAAKWLRASSMNHCSFCLRSGNNPNLTSATLGYLSTSELVNISRHEGMLVFRDMRVAMQNAHAGREEICCYVLPQNILFSWPLAKESNGRKVDDLVPKEHGAVFVPIEDCFPSI